MFFLTSAATKHLPSIACITPRRDLGERKTARHHLRPDPEQPRLLRPVQIQATRLIAFMHAKRYEIHALEVPCVQPEEFATSLAIQVLHNWKRGFADQCKAACAGRAFRGILIGIEPKDPDGGDDETAGGEQRNRGQASCPPARAPPEPEASQGESA